MSYLNAQALDIYIWVLCFAMLSCITCLMDCTFDFRDTFIFCLFCYSHFGIISVKGTCLLLSMLQNLISFFEKCSITWKLMVKLTISVALFVFWFLPFDVLMPVTVSDGTSEHPSHRLTSVHKCLSRSLNTSISCPFS